MKDYIVLDLETPNRHNNSMSSIGIVVVEDGEVVDELYSLINPETYFDNFNISFTGIRPEDVEDAPTFPEYWSEIKDLVCSNIIVGQNITFDLNVISKSLTRYKLPIPPLEYYCTLSSCKRNLNLPSNSLSYIVSNVLNTSYNAHNAMADAQMTNELYNFLADYEVRDNYIQKYYYRPNCKRDFNRKLDSNFNYLYGLLKKFNCSEELSENHYKLIEKWHNDNKPHNNHALIENVLLKISYILENKNLSQKEMQCITTSFKPIKRSPEYKLTSLKLQVLKGILDSTLCEEQLKKEDIEYIKNWIDTIKINDKSFKEFYKEINWDDPKLKDYLKKYSEYLEEYLEN